jgi:DNA-binding MarR family transcriptional regulator
MACDFTKVLAKLQYLTLPTWLKLDVSMAQLKAFVVVDREEAGISVTEIGRRLSIGEPSASLLVEQLVKRGYVVRTPDPADRRRVLVTATDLGRETLLELRQGRQQHLEEMMARMDADDVQALERGLAALARVAYEEPASE